MMITHPYQVHNTTAITCVLFHMKNKKCQGRASWCSNQPQVAEKGSHGVSLLGENQGGVQLRRKKKLRHSRPTQVQQLLKQTSVSHLTTFQAAHPSSAPTGKLIVIHCGLEENSCSGQLAPLPRLTFSWGGQERQGNQGHGVQGAMTGGWSAHLQSNILLTDEKCP